MMMSRRAALIGAGSLALAGALPVFGQDLTAISGRAFGTSWRVTLPSGPDNEALGRELSAILAEIDAGMSPFRPDSELTIFNRTSQTGWIGASAEICTVAAAALRIAALTDGAFDPTVGPAVARFGFGPIMGTRSGDYAGLAVAPDGLRKHESGLSLDLCGIAKGYAVDRLVAALDTAGHTRFLVEIGGEVFARGANPAGRSWQVGIERPGSRDIHSIAGLADQALATSGDAVNAYEIGGRRYSHVIDPATREPLRNAVASVSVLAADVMSADALATALMVMGPERGLAFAEAQRLPVMYLLRDGKELREMSNSLFRAQLLTGEA